MTRSLAFALAGLVLSFSSSVVSADGHEEEGRDTSFTLLTSQDNFFGFYPSFNGLVEVNDNMDFSFYGILWTRDAFGTTGTGDDLWTEFGAGVNLKYMDGRLNVKPQIGITNGSLLSGGETDSDGNTGGYFLDGIVPSLTINYADDRFESEWYSGYYLAARDGDTERTNDFLHLWLNGGYRFSNYVSAGLHYEWLEQTDGAAPGAEETVYIWLGPYVQFSLPKGFFARFSAGSDISDDGTGDFYKLNVGMTF
ncbi:MAG: DUF6733 family protein [Pseudomonadota bacterium]